jgi:hypothetical protein
MLLLLFMLQKFTQRKSGAIFREHNEGFWSILNLLRMIFVYPQALPCQRLLTMA